jgi:hypothetical protein
MKLIGATELTLLKNAGLFMEQMVKTRMELILHGHRHYPAYSRAGFPVAEGGDHPLAVIAWEKRTTTTGPITALRSSRSER